MDNTFNRALEFVKNVSKNKSGISNVYVFTLRDKNDNIVDECYSMNHITKYGFNYLYGAESSNKNWNSGYLYIGNGVAMESDPVYSISSHSMAQILYGGLAATVRSRTYDFAYPLYYKKPSTSEEHGLITVFGKILDCYYDYNITQFPGTFDITEYGIGPVYDPNKMTNPWNNLWTHSGLYDKYGTRISVTKTPDVRLDITVYLCLSIYEDKITSLWENKMFMTLTTANAVTEHMFLSGKHYSNNTSATIDTTQTIDVSDLNNNKIKNVISMGSFVKAVNATETGRYVNGYIAKATNGFKIYSPEELNTPDSFEYIIRGVYPETDECFASEIGHDVNIPVEQMDIANVYSFNAHTNQWDNPISFYNNPNHSYCELGFKEAEPLYITQDDGQGHERIVQLYLYQNLHTDDPIISIKNNLNQRVLYTTDKYWDKSTWEPVTSFNNIPQSSGIAHYWITDTDQEFVTPKRQSGYFYLKPNGLNNSGFEYIQNYDSLGLQGATFQCDNYQYGWFLRGNIVYVPSRAAKFNLNITVYNAQTYGKWLIVQPSSGGKDLYLIDMTSVNTQNLTPADISGGLIQLDFTASTVAANNVIMTESKTGLICLMDISGKEAIIIDLNNSNPKDTSTHKKIQCSMAHAIWGRNQIAYMSSDRTTINVHDISTDSLYWTINSPQSYSSTPMIFAHTEYIWIMNGSSGSYAIKIGSTSTDDYFTMSGFTRNFNDSYNYNNNRYAYHMSAVDNHLLVYNSNDHSFSYIFMIDLDTDDGYKTVRNGSAFDFGSNKDFHLFCDMRYVETNTLVLTLQVGMNSNTSNGGVSTMICDYGKYLNDNLVQRFYRSALGVPGYVMYGEYMFDKMAYKVPLIYCVSIKAVGTTKTISAINHDTVVSNKRFDITFTNEPLWGTGSANYNQGIPPGEQE